jgi:hypothetical protein
VSQRLSPQKQSTAHDALLSPALQVAFPQVPQSAEQLIGSSFVPQ